MSPTGVSRKYWKKKKGEKKISLGEALVVGTTSLRITY
jgi:hypothetical protein